MGDKVKIVKLNVDESPKTASKYGVMSIPTLMIFKGGEMASRQVGAAPKAKLQRLDHFRGLIRLAQEYFWKRPAKAGRFALMGHVQRYDDVPPVASSSRKVRAKMTSLVAMEARSVDEIPRGKEWQYEPKWDGFRCLLSRNGGSIDLRSKSDEDLARYFPRSSPRR